VTGGGHWLDLRGPTACEVFDEAQVAELRGRIGADPLRADADPDTAYARIRNSPTPLATLLLNQSVVAGTGLIFVTEALFRAGLAPTAAGRVVTPGAWGDLWRDLCALMGRASRPDGSTRCARSTCRRRWGGRPRVDRHGGEVYVYRRAGQPCLVCGTPIATGALAGRNAYWCPTCQPTQT